MTKYWMGSDSEISDLGNFNIPAGLTGAATNPGADQLREMNLDANWGAKNIEIEFLTPQMAYYSPEWYDKSLRETAKLAGIKPSVHGIVENPSGMSRSTGGYIESERVAAENNLKFVMERAHRIGKGLVKNPIVNIHASEAVMGSLGYYKDGVETVEARNYVDRETGRIMPVMREERVDEDGRVYWVKPEERISEIQKANFITQMEQIDSMTDYRDTLRSRISGGPDILRAMGETARKMEKEGRSKAEIDVAKKAYWEKLQKLAASEGRLARVEEEINLMEKELWKNAYRYNKDMQNPDGTPRFRNRDEYFNHIDNKYGDIENYLRKKIESKYKDLRKQDETAFKQRVKKEFEETIPIFAQYGIYNPATQFEKYVPIEKYEIEKSSETFSNAVIDSYFHVTKNLKGSADEVPKLAIENPPAHNPFGKPSETIKLIEKTKEKVRDKFIKKGFKKSEAEKLSNKLVTGTLDIGHLNLLKKYGATDKELMSEVKVMAPYIGHFHLTDNFGFDDSHLIPGWGNAPIKETLKELEKRGFFKGEGMTVLETGGAEQLGIMPYGKTLGNLGSPIYSWETGPSWHEADNYFFGSYAPGFVVPYGGESLPPIHAQEYGGGWSGLPTTFGSGGGGRQSQFGETPYA